MAEEDRGSSRGMLEMTPGEPRAPGLQRCLGRKREEMATAALRLSWGGGKQAPGDVKRADVSNPSRSCSGMQESFPVLRGISLEFTF